MAWRVSTGSRLVDSDHSAEVDLVRGTGPSKCGRGTRILNPRVTNDSGRGLLTFGFLVPLLPIASSLGRASSCRVGTMHWPLVGREAEMARALDTIEMGTGVALLGRTGVGKSRLLNELTHRVESSGMVTLRAVATESTHSVPFAPFAQLLPAGSTENRTELFRRVLASMSDLAAGRGLLLAIDDAHHLDESSLALAATVVATGTATVCLTARSGQSMKPDLVDLWTNGVIERLDIFPLDEDTTTVLVESVLGRVDTELMQRLWETAQGNPLILHEIVEGAAGRRSIVRDEDGVWGLEGPLVESPRLADLVRARTDQIPSELRHSLELVAIGAPLPVEILERASRVDLATLESTQLISVERSNHRLVVRPAHPLYGEVLAANLGRTHRRRLHRELLETAVGFEGQVDDLQMAVWQRDSGANQYPEIAVRGAVMALIRHDPVLAEQLIRPVVGTGGNAGVILGRALNFQRRFDEAERVLSGVETDDSDTLADLASARAHNLGFGLGRVAEAVEILGRAGAMVDEIARARLDVERGVISAIRGDFTGAEQAGRDVVANPASSQSARASAYTSLALSLAMRADCQGFDEIVADAFEAARAAKADVPLAESQIGVMELCALCAAGRIEEAVAVGRRFASRSSGSALLSTWLDGLALALDLTGRLRDALESASASLELMRESDPFGLELQARGLAALERGQLGDIHAGDDVKAIHFDRPDPRLSIWVDRGLVWAAVAKGAISEAVDRAVSGGRRAIDSQHYSWAGPAAHDAVRLGSPELVVDVLTDLRTERGAHLINTMADHAEALFHDDGAALTDVAGAFATMGAFLLAAETAAQAAVRLEGSDASRLVCLSMGWELKCQDPRTPALAERPGLVSWRELQVAMDAAMGHTSPEISRKRYISVRTVDNHLRSVYRKLGVSGRQELSGVLAPVL
jgi:DNA-binding CsgD family transcriptional regulator